MSTEHETMRQIQGLEIGKGVQYLLNEAHRILGNPVLVHDMEYKLIACTENIETDDPIWNEFCENKTVSLQRIEFYKTEDFLVSAANAPRSTYLRSEQLKYDRIYSKIFNCDKLQIGCAVIPEVHRPFAQNDFELFEMFCDVLNKELGLSEYYREYGQAYHEALVNKLIEGCIEDKGVYTAHVESIYINMEFFLNLAVVDTGLCRSAHDKLAYFRDEFKRLQPNYKYAIVGEHIVIIMSFEKPDSDVRKAVDQFAAIFENGNMLAGISSRFENLFELQRYYNEAVEALSKRVQANGAQRVYVYDEMKEDQDL